MYLVLSFTEHSFLNRLFTHALTLTLSPTQHNFSIDNDCCKRITQSVANEYPKTRKNTKHIRLQRIFCTTFEKHCTQILQGSLVYNHRSHTRDYRHKHTHLCYEFDQTNFVPGSACMEWDYLMTSIGQSDCTTDAICDSAQYRHACLCFPLLWLWRVVYTRMHMCAGSRVHMQSLCVPNVRACMCMCLCFGRGLLR
jgi:hypothetical protein